LVRHLINMKLALNCRLILEEQKLSAYMYMCTLLHTRTYKHINAHARTHTHIHSHILDRLDKNINTYTSNSIKHYHGQKLKLKLLI